MINIHRSTKNVLAYFNIINCNIYLDLDVVNLAFYLAHRTSSNIINCVKIERIKELLYQFVKAIYDNAAAIPSIFIYNY